MSIIDKAKTTVNKVVEKVDAAKVVNIEISQIGYKERGNNIQKYGPNGQAWCSYFQIWCFKKAFGSKTYKKITGGKPNGLANSWNKAGSHPPKSQWQPGDIITFDYNNNNVSDHVGMIIKVKGNKITTVEGNSGDKVSKKTYSKNYSGIHKVTRPDYALTGKINYSDGSDSGDVVDTGGGIDLSKEIAKLYSSDNYDFLSSSDLDHTNKKLEETKSQGKNFVASYKSSLESSNKTIEDYEKKQAENNNTTKESKIKPKTFEVPKITKFKEAEHTSNTLVSYPNFVQAPIIILDLNGTTIGGYGNSGDIYLNYIQSMKVTKVNGRINQYTINLEYKVRPNEDPNLLDKLFSQTGYTNYITIKYGDSTSPSMIFRDDEAVITNVTFNENVTSKTITYTITALSSLCTISSMSVSFPSKTDKPSNILRSIIYSNNEVGNAIRNALKGMKDKTLVDSNGLIPSDDDVVTTQAMSDVTPLEYIEYLVSCMKHNDKVYYLTYQDDTTNKYGGAYLCITSIKQSSTTDISTINTQEGKYFTLDIGYPSSNFVTDFQFNNDTYFPLVYQYNSEIPTYYYDIDSAGNMISSSVNTLVLNNDYHMPNVVQSNWWKNVTEYPVTAKVTLKGLTKPIILMSYIRVNTVFYGNKDLASGLYVVINQEDNISGSGYSTTLTLLRVGS